MKFTWKFFLQKPYLDVFFGRANLILVPFPANCKQVLPFTFGQHFLNVLIFRMSSFGHQTEYLDHDLEQVWFL